MQCGIEFQINGVAIAINKKGVYTDWRRLQWNYTKRMLPCTGGLETGCKRN